MAADTPAALSNVSIPCCLLLLEVDAEVLRVSADEYLDRTVKCGTVAFSAIVLNKEHNQCQHKRIEQVTVGVTLRLRRLYFEIKSWHALFFRTESLRCRSLFDWMVLTEVRPVSLLPERSHKDRTKIAGSRLLQTEPSEVKSSQVASLVFSYHVMNCCMSCVG